MNSKLLMVATGIIFLAACNVPKENEMKWFDRAVSTSGHQLLYMAEKLKNESDTLCFPRSLKEGKYRLENTSDWTSGFFPGCLWLAYELTAKEELAKQARLYTDRLEAMQYYTKNHDLGFMMFCSSGNAYRLTGEQKYKEILLRTADSLATLFDKRVGTIHSWPGMRKQKGWPHNTIIDNMLNLELLFWASKNGGGKDLYNIAYSHALVTSQNQFRVDYSTCHVVVYDTIIGKRISQLTHQGYADKSMFAR